MKLVKRTKNYSIFKKRSGRFCVRGRKGGWIRADEKVKILVDEKLLKKQTAKPKPAPAPAETAPKEAAPTEAPPESNQ